MREDRRRSVGTFAHGYRRPIGIVVAAFAKTRAEREREILQRAGVTGSCGAILKVAAEHVFAACAVATVAASGENDAGLGRQRAGDAVACNNDAGDAAAGGDE